MATMIVAIEPKPTSARGMNHSARWGCMAKVSSGSSARICLRTSSAVGVVLIGVPREGVIVAVPYLWSDHVGSEPVTSP